MSDKANAAFEFLHSEGVETLLADVAEHNEKVREMPTGQEVRVVDAETGGAKGSKLARFDLVPFDALTRVAEHYGRGSRKYEDRNWERGYKWGLSFAALHRHLASFWQGDDIDHDESLYEGDEPHTVRHIDAVVWHALALSAFDLRGIGTDDRPVKP